MKKCIFVCIFGDENYVKMFYLFLESLYLYANLDENTEILVYTSSKIMKTIKVHHLYKNIIKFAVHDNYHTSSDASKARLDFFDIPSINMYEKILYLDIDIIIKRDINHVFDICKEDILYALEEGCIDNEKYDYWGHKLFTAKEIEQYDDKSAFIAGMLLFNNCTKIKTLFKNIKEDMISRALTFSTCEQPYIIYSAFKYKLYDNKQMKAYAINNNYDIHSDIIIHHFPYGVGNYPEKLVAMNKFLQDLKNETANKIITETKKFIEEELFPIIEESGETIEGNLFTEDGILAMSDIFILKIRNVCNMARISDNVLEIGFNAGFSAALMLFANPKLKLTCIDIGQYKYTAPCFEKLKKIFADRIQIIYGDSCKVLSTLYTQYDMIHIDVRPTIDVAVNDINQAYRLSRHGTILIMDGYNFLTLNEIWNSAIKQFNLKNLEVQLLHTNLHDIKYCHKHISIVVATPAFGGICYGGYLTSLIQLSSICISKNIDIEVIQLYNESLITRARNTLCKQFMDDYPYSTHLLFLDADIQFEPNDIIRMLEFNKPVIGGIYPKKSIKWDKIASYVNSQVEEKRVLKVDDLQSISKEYVCILKDENTDLNNELIEVRYTGTGILLIKREVFDKMQNVYANDTYNVNGIIYQRYFDVGLKWIVSEQTNIYLSEDYWFCQRWKELGGSTYLYTKMRCKHWGIYQY